MQAAACSPDLSWKESMWSWAEHHLNPSHRSVRSASDPIAKLQTAMTTHEQSSEWVAWGDVSEQSDMCCFHDG